MRIEVLCRGILPKLINHLNALLHRCVQDPKVFTGAKGSKIEEIDVLAED